MSATLTPSRQQFREAVALVASKAKAKLPECNGRVESAVQIVLSGDVEGQDADGAWRIGSTSDPLKTYHVRGTHCDCQDSQHGKAPYCKHTLAIMILTRVKEMLPQPTDTDPAGPPDLPEAA